VQQQGELAREFAALVAAAGVDGRRVGLGTLPQGLHRFAQGSQRGAAGSCMPTQVPAAQARPGRRGSTTALARPGDRREGFLGGQDDAQFPADRAHRCPGDHVEAGAIDRGTMRGAAASRRGAVGVDHEHRCGAARHDLEVPGPPDRRLGEAGRACSNGPASTPRQGRPTSRPSASRSGAAIITAAP
jgi:hypothetical protein